MNRPSNCSLEPDGVGHAHTRPRPPALARRNLSGPLGRQVRMRTVVLALLLLILPVGFVGAGERESGEVFPAFLGRFVQDEGFRESRIKFPLRAVLGNPTDPRIKEKWSREQLDDKFIVPVASDRLEAAGLEQQISHPSGSEVEVEQSQPESDSYILIYRFKLKKGQWFLVEFENGSY